MCDTRIFAKTPHFSGGPDSLTQDAVVPSPGYPEILSQIISAYMYHMVYITDRQLVEW